MSGIVGPRLIPTPPSFADTKSFQLDGNIDFVTYADNSNLSFGDGVTDSPFSISAWIKVTTGTAFIIVGKYLAYPNGEYKFVKQADGTVLIRIISGNNELSRRGRTTNSIDSLVGQWVHVVSTYNGNSDYSGLKIYIDGVRSDVANNGKNVYTAMSNTTYPLNIGKFANTNVNEVSIFNSELSQSEVLSIFNGGLPDSLTAFNPLLWLRMGEEATWNGSEFVLDNQGSIGGTATSVGITPTDPNPTTDVPLFDNKSFTYDGITDYINTNTTIVGTTFSISAWFKVANTTDLQPIVSTRENSISSSNGIDIYIQSDILTFRIYRNGGTSVTQAFTDLGWNHVLYVYDGTTLEGFLNGISIGSAVGTYATSTQTLKTGIFIPSSEYAETYIDEVALFYTDESANVSTIFNGGVPNDISALSPLGYWRAEQVTFDGTDWTLIDQGSGANNGTSVSMPLTSRTSDVPLFDNKSFSFDGIGDYVTMGNVLDFQRTSAFSISAWIKRGVTGVNDTIVSKMESSGNFRGYLLFISSTNLVKFVLRNVNMSSNRLFVDSTSTITDTNWHHILMTYDGSSSVSGVKIYIDGVSDTVTTEGTLNATTLNSSPFNIGARNSNSLFATANIDETAIFNLELSASDVTSIYNSGVPNDISAMSGLVSWWRMGEEAVYTTLWTLTDQGSGGNDGTSVSMSLTSRTSDVPT